jgi:hypothetical protein
MSMNEVNHDDEQARYLDDPACRCCGFVGRHTRHGRNRNSGKGA